MSVDAIRRIIEKPGCSITAAAVLLLAMVLGLSNAECGGPNRLRQEDVSREVLAEIGSQKLYRDEFETIREQIEQQQGANQFLMQSNPFASAQMMGAALQQAVDRVYMQELGRAKGLKLTDEELKALFQLDIERQVQQTRMQLAMSGALKMDASEQEFAKAFKEASGRELAEVKKEANEQFATALKDKTKRAQIAADFTQPALLQTVASSVPASEEAVKRGFRDYKVQTIFIPEAEGKDPLAECEKVYAEIQGGLAFDKAVEQVKGKVTSAQPSDGAPFNLPYSQIENNPDLTPLKTMQAGEVSKPSKIQGGAAIYKLIEVKENLPDDFEQRKPQYTEQYKQTLAQSLLAADLRNLREEKPVVWKDKGFELLYKFMSMRPDTWTKEEMRDLCRESLEAAGGSEVSEQPAAYVAYLTGQEYVALASEGEEKTEARGLLVQATEALLSFTENAMLRLSLVEQYLEAKEYEKAYQQLLAASQANSDPEITGQMIYSEVDRHAIALEKANALTPEQKTELDAAQKAWRELRAEHDKTQEEIRKQEEAMRQEAEQATSGASTAGATTAGGPLVPPAPLPSGQ